MIFSLFLLFFFLFLGESCKTWLGLQFPGSVLGLLFLLSFLLLSPKVKPHWSQASDLILKNLAILFVPAGVGLMSYGGVLYHDLAGLLLVLVVGTALVLVLSALFMSRLGHKK